MVSLENSNEMPGGRCIPRRRTWGLGFRV